MKKLVSIVVPIYNEVEMIQEICTRVAEVFKTLNSYTYEIVFFDDGSTDGTRTILEEVASNQDEIKCVFLSKNFGYLKNTFYCLQQAKGDCAVILHADLQNPPELIPAFLKSGNREYRLYKG